MSINPEAPPKRKLNILLAEDNLVNQKVALRLLENRGHYLTVAGNGREAVECAITHSYDVILMDIQMPEMDGFEAARQIRVHEASGWRAPIIAMTAHAMIGDRENCLSRGMDGYIAKPINRAKLIEAVERVAEEFAQAPERYVGMGNGHTPGDLSSTLSSLQRRRDL